jgi:NAD(P)-dependent dehydrogenase (short-subunit alcohol dehydrogenase family)
VVLEGSARGEEEAACHLPPTAFRSSATERRTSTERSRDMDTGLGGRVVAITGAASGIGRATAKAFAGEGAQLALVDLDEDELRGLGGELDGHAGLAVADLSTPDGVRSGLDQALQPFGGRLDVLVNNVGMGAVRTFDDLADEDWQRTLELNFYSYVRAIRFALPRMREQRAGVIINNASDLARQPEPVPIDYAVSKTAILSLTKALARAEGPTIRVNAVAPGPVWTPFWTKPGGFAETMGRFYDMPPEQAVEHEMKQRQLPMQRLGRPEEVAGAIVFLASDQASFITSTVLGVDGGSIRNVI